MLLRALTLSLLLSRVALAQVPPPMEDDDAPAIDLAREEQIANQIEQLRTDLAWVAYRAAWQRREESITPRALEPLVGLALRAVESYQRLTVGVDAEHLERIELPPGLILIEEAEGAPMHAVLEWNAFSMLAAEHGLPEDQQFFALMGNVSALPSESSCVSLTIELEQYREWRAFAAEYPHAYTAWARQQLSETMRRLSTARRSSDDAATAIESLRTFIEEQPADPMASTLRSHLRAIEAGRMEMQAACEMDETMPVAGISVRPTLSVVRD